MPDSKIYVQKRGPIHKVYLDDRQQPVSLSSHEDNPAGTFPFTYTSLRELQNSFPGREFVFLEKPAKPQNVITRTPEILAESARRRKTSADMPTPTIEDSPKVVTNSDSQLVTMSDTQKRSEEFLKRLEFAERYASEENRVTLAIQITIVSELLDEVFRK